MILGDNRYNFSIYVESTDDTVSVPAGTFNNCLRLRQLTTITSGTETAYDYKKFWHAPGIGPIVYSKYSDNWENVRFKQELKSYYTGAD